MSHVSIRVNVLLVHSRRQADSTDDSFGCSIARTRHWFRCWRQQWSEKVSDVFCLITVDDSFRIICASLFRNKLSSKRNKVVYCFDRLDLDQLPHSRISLTTQHAKQPPSLICRITLIAGVPLATIWGLLDVLLGPCRPISSGSWGLDSCTVMCTTNSVRASNSA